MTEFPALRTKTYSSFTNDDDEKRHKKVCHKTENLNLKIMRIAWKEIKLKKK